MSSFAAAQNMAMDLMKDLNALVRELDEPIRGKADWRKYRCFQILSNGITVCCVNDATSKSTAVATTVNVGAAYDPRTISGLARTYVGVYSVSICMTRVMCHCVLLYYC